MPPYAVPFLECAATGRPFLVMEHVEGVPITEYCDDHGLSVDGRCPITGKTARDESCPLWLYIAADVPTAIHGSPFESLHA